MKKEKSVWILAFILTAGLSMSSCTKDEELTNELARDQMEDSVESGAWVITRFEESGKDETNHFSGYDFTFHADGKLLAENGENSYEGTWSITDDNSNDDSQSDLHFNIYFALSNDFEDLNDDWDVLSNTDVKIVLIDVSGGNGGTDYLTLEKK